MVGFEGAVEEVEVSGGVALAADAEAEEKEGGVGGVTEGVGGVV